MSLFTITGSFTVLETPRLYLRKLNLGDAEDVYEYASDPEVTRYTLWDPHTSLEDSENYLHNLASLYASHQPAPWGLELKATHKLIGSCGFVNLDLDNDWGEIGCALARLYWGKGLMTEAVKAVIAYGFANLNLYRIQAMCDCDNLASSRTLERVGMHLEGVLRGFVYARGAYRDQRMYSILREEYLHVEP